MFHLEYVKHITTVFIMKHKLLHLQSLVAVALCVIMATAFTSCSDDDDEPAADIVGTWECITGTIHDWNYGGDDFEKGDCITFMKGGRCLLPWDDISDPEDGWSSWILKGNELTVMECDLDRWIGIITVNGNEMTFTYKYQNWHYDSGTMTEESKETYVSTFKKK